VFIFRQGGCSRSLSTPAPSVQERTIRNPTLELVERAYIFWVLL